MTFHQRCVSGAVNSGFGICSPDERGVRDGAGGEQPASLPILMREMLKDFNFESKRAMYSTYRIDCCPPNHSSHRISISLRIVKTLDINGFDGLTARIAISVGIKTLR